MPRESIRGKTALITGAAQRLGRVTALALAGEGANIIVHYRSSEVEAEELAGDIRRRGVQAWTVQADFAQPEEYTSLLPRALHMAGSLDILINSASIFPANTLADITFAGLMSNTEVNAWAPFVLMRCFKELVGAGKIVNLLDTRINGYDWGHVGYIVSKHILAVFTQMTALDYAPDITVNAVAPGLILPPPGQTEEYLDKLVDTVPLKRHGEPEDVADAIVYLLTSAFCTGNIIYVDGGRHLKEHVNGRSYPH